MSFQEITKDLLYNIPLGNIFKIRHIRTGQVFIFIYLGITQTKAYYKIQTFPIRYLKHQKVLDIFLEENDKLFEIEINE